MPVDHFKNLQVCTGRSAQMQFENFAFFKASVLIFSCAIYQLLRVQVWYNDTTPGTSDNAFTTQPLVFLSGFSIEKENGSFLEEKKGSLASTPAKA